MKTVLVTGANGFVGYYLVQHFLRSSYRVVASGRSKEHSFPDHPHFNYYQFDFTDPLQVQQVLKEVQPDVVVHSGAMSKPDDCEMNKELALLTNVTGTANLLAEAKKCNSHFIFLSTDFVFSGERGMYSEEEQRSPVNYYGQTKVLAEDAVMQYPFQWSIVRTVLVYGRSANGKLNFVEHVAAALRRNETLRIFHDQVRTLTYVEDLASGIVDIAERKAEGIYHLSGKDAMTVYEAACKVAQFIGQNDSQIQPIREGDLNAPAQRPKLTGFTITKAQKDLGYDPVSFETGLQKTFQSNVVS